MVTVMELCRNIRCNVAGCTPIVNSRVAQEWRTSCIAQLGDARSLAPAVERTVDVARIEEAARPIHRSLGGRRGWGSLLWFRYRRPRRTATSGATSVKSDGELMEILNAYVLTGSYRAAGELCGCSHHTVQKAVEDRDGSSRGRQWAVPDVH